MLILTRTGKTAMEFNTLTDFKKIRILLCNDDGIEAKGIRLLEKILTPLCDDIWVVAPDKEKSGASHAISTDTLRSMAGHSAADALPVGVRQTAPKHFAVDGTPSDCVRAAFMLSGNKKPDLIISGINNGRNIADDITYSGTIGAATEGLLHGVRSIAVSQLTDGAENVSWNLIEHHLPDILHKICAVPCSADSLVNINFPNVFGGQIKGLKICRQGTRRLFSDNDNSSFPADFEEVYNGFITVSALKINLTNEQENLRLRELFANQPA